MNSHQKCREDVFLARMRVTLVFLRKSAALPRGSEIGRGLPSRAKRYTSGYGQERRERRKGGSVGGVAVDHSVRKCENRLDLNMNTK